MCWALNSEQDGHRRSFMALPVENDFLELTIRTLIFNF